MEMNLIKTKKKKGFTLIELIVVIAIIGILAAIAVPRLTSFRGEATAKADIATARTILSAGTIAEATNGNAFTEAQLNENLNEDVTLSTTAPTTGTGWTLVKPAAAGSSMSVYKGTLKIVIP